MEGKEQHKKKGGTDARWGSSATNSFSGNKSPNVTARAQVWGGVNIQETPK